jgi:hypothetical protein
MTWDKDAWILEAIAKKMIVPREDGAVFRFAGVKDGKRVFERIKVSTHAKSGRVYFNLTHAGITKSVLLNRVIGLAFLPNPEGHPEVNHLDGDKAHNAVANLEWAGRSAQEKHAFAHGLKSIRGSANGNAKLTAQDVLDIRSDHQNNDVPIVTLAETYKVSKRTIEDVLKRKTWEHL